MGRLVESLGDQNPGPEAPLRSNIGRESKGKRKCQRRSDCHKIEGEKLVCQSH